MSFFPPMRVEQTQILNRRELGQVLADGIERKERSLNAWRNLIIVRLACCCGLRVSEIAPLQISDVIVGIRRPHIRLRREITKGNRPRQVPLWWDAGTLADLVAWTSKRSDDQAKRAEPFICSVQAHRHRIAVAEACHSKAVYLCMPSAGSLPNQDADDPSRPAYVRQSCIAGGRSLAEVQAAAGHCNVAVTSAYLHILVDNEDPVGELFRTS